jgi:hypothetical protein
MNAQMATLATQVPHRQAAFDNLNQVILRLAVKRERPLDPRHREEVSNLVDQALEAYREFMKIPAA